MMTPQTYYVSITSGTIEMKPSRTDQLSIQATEEELTILQRKLQQEEKITESTSLRAAIPFKSAERDPAQEKFSDDLLDLYAYIYRLGTPRTREHIESMNILPKLTNQNSHYPGYN
ncbi:hypothetical protein K0T92_01945 [Paenibacillus oenotherae]|uniref:Hydrolase n=1 Tax=Paenibacillus oenotherae TaxID=1435645 RepID=A0ABS7D0T8_9BACL|nr:hypothetical protein [Paenibacillus oenotherae]MBW7473504.1 hypothetical protein [Paenibacillus oenotherae]